MEMEAEELRAWATLLRIPGLTFERVTQALQAVTSVADLVRAARRRPELLGLTEHARSQLQELDTGLIDRDLAWLAEPKRHLIPLTSPLDPPLLAHLGGAPP